MGNEIKRIGQNVKERKSYIDILRGIGLILIFFAHSYDKTDWVWNARCFDVPLMVFVSALAYGNRNMLYSKQWLVKRFKRLVYPLWIFLTLYFIFQFITSISDTNLRPTITTIGLAYIFMYGTSYIWIFRIFLYVGLLTPALIWINKKIKRFWLFLLFILCVMLAQQLLFCEYGDNLIVRESLLSLIGYSSIFLVGLRFRDFNDKRLILHPLLFVLSITTIGALYYNLFHKGSWYDITQYKYPPQFLFIIYGLFCSTVLSLSFRKVHHLNNKVVRFFCSNTSWIYLWHIAFIMWLENLQMPWIANFAFLLILSVSVTYIQVTFVHFCEKRLRWTGLKYLIG